jgi:negative regulator of flagellin synthesis FlgM
MNIEITGGKSNSIPTQTPPKPGVTSGGGDNSVAAPTEKNDSVALTAASQEITKAFGSSSTAPVNTDRVNAIKKAITNGSYSVDGKKVANKLLQFESSLPQENNTPL